jgi:hypothetical protein
MRVMPEDMSCNNGLAAADLLYIFAASAYVYVFGK